MVEDIELEVSINLCANLEANLGKIVLVINWFDTWGVCDTGDMVIEVLRGKDCNVLIYIRNILILCCLPRKQMHLV